MPVLRLPQLDGWSGQHIKFRFGLAELELSGRDQTGVTGQGVQHSGQQLRKKQCQAREMREASACIWAS